MGAIFEYMGGAWVGVGGRGCDIIVHGWAWVGICHVCVGMGGRGCNLKGKCGTLMLTLTCGLG